MCTGAAILSTAMQIGGDYLAQKSMARSAQDAMNAQATAAITDMNYAFQNFEQERTDAFDSALTEIDNARQNAIVLESGVEAAVNENQSGRTAGLLVRAAKGDTNRAVSTIQDNYSRKSNEIDLNKESKYKSTRAYIDNLNASAPKMPSRFSNFVSGAASALGSYTEVMNQRNALKAAGMKQNWLTGGAKSPDLPIGDLAHRLVTGKRGRKR